jgi:hypothetical protein
MCTLWFEVDFDGGGLISEESSLYLASATFVEVPQSVVSIILLAKGSWPYVRLIPSHDHQQ